MTKRMAWTRWLVVAMLSVGLAESAACAAETPAYAWPEGAITGFFAERPWYDELVAALAADAPAPGSYLLRVRAAEHPGERAQS